jgi:hypothetical protein
MIVPGANLEQPARDACQSELQFHIKPGEGQIKGEAAGSCIRSDAEERHWNVTVCPANVSCNFTVVMYSPPSCLD